MHNIFHLFVNLPIMKGSPRQILYFFLLLTSPSLLEAQSVNKYANAFLDIGVGARALGMSNAVVASNKDITGGYWNPAGLTAMDRDLQISFMHNEHFAGIVKYDYGAIGMKFKDNSAGAFTFIRSGVDNIPNTLELVDANGNVNYDKVKSFSAADYAFQFSYARTIAKIKGLSYGGTVKLIYRHIGEFGNGWGFGFDFGVRYQHKKNWIFASQLRDATSTITNFSYNTEVFRVVFAATGNEIISTSSEIATPRWILATAKRFELPKNFRILVEANIAVTFDGRRNVLLPAGPMSFDPMVGVEFEYNDIVFIRGGVGKFQYIKDPEGGKNVTALPSVGLGLKYKGFSIDYTLANFGNSIMGMSHVFSARVDLNIKKKSQP